MDSSVPVFTARAVTKRFGSTVALTHVDLDLHAGEIVALMGMNGAGKSTFVKMASGVGMPDNGVLTLQGKPFAPRSPQDARRLGIATVHQSVADAVVPSISIADNLLLDRLCDPASPWRMTLAQRRDAARPLAARVGLEADLDAPLGALPLAGQQLVVLARALADRPALLILDEPSASLSAPEAQHIFGLVERLRDEGVAVLLVSHRLGDVRRLADRIAILRDGRVAADLRPPFDLDAAIETMVGRRLPAPRSPHARASTSSPPAFSARALKLRPNGVPFDLDVWPGEIVAIVGPVGGGKSTFARAIFGDAPVLAGEMRLNGARWHPRSPAESIRAGVFLAAEDRSRSSAFPDSVSFSTIAGTIGFPFLSRWHRFGFVRRCREREAALRAIDVFGIRCGGPDDRLARLSGGNQQKVVLARWHAEPARLLLLDEPFQGVDALARADIAKWLRQGARERATIVFVSDLDEAHEIGDRIVSFDRATLEPAQST
ncbi:sugar ABC transporter ATP-binding protein [Trinickia diaoshuihuensis]|uniref:sugar ABC transporter ATP-binding protein n=1 Tax=Trinickia diaoshuihuensis TaxID=2292265 RepID=UPI000E24D233|nr:sugar ABC transporter ATP-binding protein [Trinickia diaoshuihuensis]